jgi:hypothetical protein
LTGGDLAAAGDLGLVGVEGLATAAVGVLEGEEGTCSFTEEADMGRLYTHTHISTIQRVREYAYQRLS